MGNLYSFSKGFSMMDFVTPLLALLVPHLPALLNKAAEDVVGEGAKKVVFGAVPKGVAAIWAKVWPKVEGNAVAKASADAVADQPGDEDAAMMLKLALKKVLEGIEKSDPEMLAQLKVLMVEETSQASAGNVATVTAGTIYSSVVGDGATVTQTFGGPGK